jgi:hypothetical protein
MYFLFHAESADIRRYLTKTLKTLFEIFGTLCLCSAIVMNLAVSKLPPASCQYHNISFWISKLSKRKTLKTERRVKRV